MRTRAKLTLAAAGASAGLFLSACQQLGVPAANATPTMDAVAEIVQADLPPGLSVDEIRPSPVSGLLELRVGTDILYVTQDGKTIVRGSMLDRASKRDLTAVRRAEVVAEMLAAVPLDEAHVYPTNAAKPRRIFVFTDPSCPYCQRFHEQVPSLTAMGVEVVYLGFPREGIGSQPYDQLTAAFCSKDPDAAFDAIMKPGTQTDSAGACLSPVDYHFDLARQLEVSGTPAIFDASGRQIGGYLTAEQLVAALEAK